MKQLLIFVFMVLSGSTIFYFRWKILWKPHIHRTWMWGSGLLILLISLSHLFLIKLKIWDSPSLGITGLRIVSGFLMGWLSSFIIYSLPAWLWEIWTWRLNPWLDKLKNKDRSNVTQQPTVERREFLRQWTGLSVAALAGTTSTIGFHTALKGPEIIKVDIPLDNWPKEYDGFRIAQISDVHIGPLIHKAEVEAIVEKTMQLNADLIVMTGDLVDGRVDSLTQHALALKGLHARNGIFYVTGNHEYYWGAENWIRFVTDQLGWIHLMNESRQIGILQIGGVPDAQADRFIESHISDPIQAAQNISMLSTHLAFQDKILLPDTTQQPVSIKGKILLAHRPESCFKAAEAGFDLQLSGHTHGGQFFPLGLFASLANPYLRGLNRHQNKMWVYVNQGTGYWGPPNRFATPAEITLLRLRHQPQSGSA